jgi:tagatose 6-phosphate kinase
VTAVVGPLILTVTLNPALDVTYTVDAPVVAGTTHRVREVAVRAGGKGLNVARVLTALDAPVLATGLLGGGTGEQIAALLAAAGVAASFVRIAAESRRTVAVTDGAGATGFWEPGPHVSAAEWESFLAHYRESLTGAATVVLCGSLPREVADDAYAVLISIAHESGVDTVLDTDGPALRAGLVADPRVVKPNAAELAAATGFPVSNMADAQAAARALRAGGTTAVVASLGSAGLVASTVDGDWRASLPAPLNGNPTGAGDACVAALAAGRLNPLPWPELLADAVACSAAAVASPVAGAVDPDRVRRLRPHVVVEEIR